jgi:hypothetical protein
LGFSGEYFVGVFAEGADHFFDGFYSGVVCLGFDG